MVRPQCTCTSTRRHIAEVGKPRSSHAAALQDPQPRGTNSPPLIISEHCVPLAADCPRCHVLRGRSERLPSQRGNHSFFWRIRVRSTLEANKFGNRSCSCHSTPANIGIVEALFKGNQYLSTCTKSSELALDTCGASQDPRTRDLLSPVEGIRSTSGGWSPAFFVLRFCGPRPLQLLWSTVVQ